jgi:hypothetical protein
MKPVTMADIEKARTEVGVLIKAKQEGERSETHLALIQVLEGQIDSLIIQYHAQPDCPCCRQGKMIETSTKGRLGCERCQAIALVGHVQ